MSSQILRGVVMTENEPEYQLDIEDAVDESKGKKKTAAQLLKDNKSRKPKKRRKRSPSENEAYIKIKDRNETTAKGAGGKGRHFSMRITRNETKILDDIVDDFQQRNKEHPDDFIVKGSFLVRSLLHYLAEHDEVRDELYQLVRDKKLNR